MKNNLQDWFLTHLCNISIYYAADCNMDCEYCYISKDRKHATVTNQKIRAALKDGSFVQNIKDWYVDYPEKIENVSSYSLWGAEPTINGDLFKNFHISMFDFFPKMDEVDFSTNSWCGAESLLRNFILPMYEYAEQNQRKTTFNLQFSLDGPAWLNDKSRKKNATENTILTIEQIIQKTPQSDYFTLQITCKPTWTLNVFELMTQNDNLQKYYDWADELCTKYNELVKTHSNIQIDGFAPTPTFVTPILATVEQGKMFAAWINKLMTLKTDHFTFYNKRPLYDSGFGILRECLFSQWNVSDYYNLASCCAGKESWHVEPDGTICSCNHISTVRIGKQTLSDTLLDKTHSFKSFTSKKDLQHFYTAHNYHENAILRYNIFVGEALALIDAGQIDKEYVESEDKMLLLWRVSLLSMCQMADMDVTGNEFVTTFGRIRLWGNGALPALIKYYQWELKRIYGG